MILILIRCCHLLHLHHRTLNPATITMNGNKTVSAIFTAVPTYTLAPSAGTQGTIATSTPPRLSSAAKSQDVTLVFVKP